MAPYSYTPILRFTPPAGPKTSYDFTTFQYLTVAQPIWEPVFLEKEYADYSYRSDFIGWRVSARLELDVIPGSATDTSLAALAALICDNDVATEITMDGTTYRVCFLREWTRVPLDSKNIGAKYSMLFVCRDIVKNASVGLSVERKGPPVMTGW